MKTVTLLRTLAFGTYATLALLATGQPQTSTPKPVVNINTATEQQLQLLPGVGPKLASEIYTFAETGDQPSIGPVDNRCDHRCWFRTADDLLKVRGIGKRKLDAMRPYIVLTGPTTATRKIKVQRPDKASKPAPVAPAVHDRRCPPDTRC